MKITKSYLRQIIKEELARKLDEMPYAGTFRGAGDKDIITPGDYGIADPPFSRRGKDPDATTRYVRSAKFQDDAIRLYANIQFPVWLAPLFSKRGSPLAADIGSELERAGIMDLASEGLDYLASKGFDGIEKIDPIGDLVIVAGGLNVNIGGVSSPWMIFHGIFDSLQDDYTGNISELAPGITDLVNDMDMSGIDIDVLTSCLTMGSVRKGEFNGQTTDMIAEMMCQELLDKRGLHFNFNMIDDPEIQVQIEEFGDRVKDLVESFRQGARGKLILVHI